MSENKRVTIPFLKKVLEPIVALINKKANSDEIPSIEGLATETYVREQITAIPTPDVSGQIAAHNIDTKTHPDIRAAIPTKVSDLTNDAGYLTQHQSLAGYATETYVDNKVAGLVDSAPETLDTLNELAAALGDNPNFATTLATQIGEIQTAITINYDALEFDTTEIVFDAGESPILGQGMLDQLALE